MKRDAIMIESAEVSQTNNARTSYVVALSLVVNNGLTEACKMLLLSCRDVKIKQNTVK